MRLFLDNSVFSIQRVGGVSVYWYELFERLRRSDLDITVINADPESDNLLEQRIDYSDLKCVSESGLSPRWLRYLPMRRRLPPGSIFHAGYLRVSTQRDVINIITVHDFAHERGLASSFPRKWVHILQKAYGIRRADGIICISESTRRDLFELYPDTSPAKVRVIHHGIAQEYKQLPEPAKLSLETGDRCVLYIGARGGYKNFAVAVGALEELGTGYRLVVVGGEKWTKGEINFLRKRIPGGYRILPIVDVPTMNLLYNRAFCLLYPSAYEGFGFPPGEAMKAGCPVVAARRSSIPEVTGDAGLLSDEISAQAFAKQIRRLEDSSFRQAIIERGLRHAVSLTWDRCASETLRFYRDCWEAKFSRSSELPR